MRLFCALLAICLAPSVNAQYDSIAFHLYTDSLKKGIANYISVDGRRVSDGRWFPLSGDKVTLLSSAGEFEGNDLWIDSSFRGDSIVVTARLADSSRKPISTTIFMKRDLSEKPLKTEEEILRSLEQPARTDRRRNKA